MLLRLIAGKHDNFTRQPVGSGKKLANQSLAEGTSPAGNEDAFLGKGLYIH
jgi:hypothetical protein